MEAVRPLPWPDSRQCRFTTCILGGIEKQRFLVVLSAKQKTRAPTNSPLPCMAGAFSRKDNVTAFVVVNNLHRCPTLALSTPLPPPPICGAKTEMGKNVGKLLDYFLKN